jgi:phosphate butyryltransferase
LSVKLVKDGKAGILMKGLIHTAEFLRSLLSKEEGLRQAGKLLSHVYVLEVPSLGRLLLVTDSAFNIAPDVEAKAAIASNAAMVAHCLGMAKPRIAAVAAVEVVNPKMPATLDAAELARRGKAGAFPDFILEGPFGLDNAISPAAASLKGVQGEVAGRADILLVPDIETGNIFCKGFAFLGGGSLAGVLAGAKAPVVLCSRADSDKAKLYSIALAHLMAEKCR